MRPEYIVYHRMLVVFVLLCTRSTSYTIGCQWCSCCYAPGVHRIPSAVSGVRVAMRPEYIVCHQMLVVFVLLCTRSTSYTIRCQWCSCCYAPGVHRIPSDVSGVRVAMRPEYIVYHRMLVVFVLLCARSTSYTIRCQWCSCCYAPGVHRIPSDVSGVRVAMRPEYIVYHRMLVVFVLLCARSTSYTIGCQWCSCCSIFSFIFEHCLFVSL